MYKIMSFEHRGLLCILYSLFYFLACSSLGRTSCYQVVDYKGCELIFMFCYDLGGRREISVCQH